MLIRPGPDPLFTHLFLQYGIFVGPVAICDDFFIFFWLQ